MRKMAKRRVGYYACYVREAERPLLIEAKTKREATDIVRTLGYGVKRCSRLSVPKKRRLMKPPKRKYF